MSHQALQRVVVRMLHDPLFALKVHAGLVVQGLTDTELGWLQATDLRAWHTDPYRRSRVLQSLIEEYPCTTALVVWGGSVKRVDAFMSDPAFHDAIQERRSLALAFGDWLLPRAEGVAAFERAVAAARRWRRPRGEGLALATGACPVALPEGTLARWQHVRSRLGAEPLARLVTGDCDLAPVPPLGDALEHWVVVQEPDGSTGLVGSSPGTHALLEGVTEVRPRSDWMATLADLGAEPDVAEALLAELAGDGVLA